MKKAKLLLLFVILTISLGMISSAPEEGMYPLSEIENIDLVEAGLKIDPKEIYNPDGVSLIDALVKINGCTGSFVSSDGLVITNHHCAFGAIRQASTPEENYLENGFLAETREKEIPAPGYVVRITESYEDVSEQILNSASGAADLAERAKLIEEKIKEIEKEASDQENSIEARVSEMFIGKTYILFKYRLIKDVRLVYAPPRSIGEFGGELDNWVWPRHTGDFTFMRAYVAPDGSAADYSEENVPYSPKRFLKVNPNGVQEGDFVFILGYPGRTYRHRTSSFLEYQQYYQLPFISELYEWMINKLEDISSEDPAIALKYASYIKGLANTKKNYQGKLKGLRRIELIDKKKEEEKLLQQFIDSDNELKNNYGTLLQEINEAYKPRFEHGYSNLWLGNMLRFSAPIRIASSVLSFKENISKLPEENYDSLFIEQALRFEGRMKNAFSSLDPDFDKPLLAKVIKQAVLNSDQFKIDALKPFENSTDLDQAIDVFIEGVVYQSDIINEEEMMEMISEDPEDVLDIDDPLLDFVKSLNEQFDAVDKTMEEWENKMTDLLAKLVEVKREWKKTSFVPDANSTLRLTYGHISGYSPADAVYYSPITTLDGVIDKSLSGEDDYQIPQKLRELFEQQKFGRFYDDGIGGLPTGILYNMDTTGGNSGSPILDAYGNLIGVNFDRAYEATINDFAWDQSYSRSIGVDIRYVLWVTQFIGGADYLLAEMGVDI